LIRAVEQLVSRGHRFHDVIHVYTADQVMAFAKEGQANRAMEMLDFSTAMRMAGSGPKDWTKYVDAIMGTAKTEPKIQDKPSGISREQANILRKLLGGKSVRTN
jgi:hypothetical protein